MIENHLKSIGNLLNELSLRYDNFILIGDFNSEMTEEPMKAFCNSYNLKCLIKKPTCSKNINNPSCIDLILTNRSSYFQNTSVIETGLSDCHKLTMTTMKSNFEKQEPKVIHFRNYKKFNNDIFCSELKYRLCQRGLENIDCITFETLFMETLNRHNAPLKMRFVRANNSPFMNENLCKAIMVRSRLRNIFLKLKTEDSWNAYRKQRNYCVSLLRITKRKFYEDLKPNSITDNKKFWKQVKPYFSDKTPSNSRIILSEGNEIISNPVQCAEIFNNYFSDPVKNLDINRRLHVCDVRNIHDPIIKAIEMYKDHPSITKINSPGFTNAEFSFKPVTEKVVQDFIQNLDSSKAFQKYNIPPKLLKNNIDICTTVLSYDINKCINGGIFLSNLKDANITPIFKKLARLFKENYRPVSILPTLSKIYENVFYYQMYDYFNDIFSKFLCGFRKGHSTQNCLLHMMEYLKKALDKGLSIGILLTDLSKAFDCISHGLLIAKLNAYGFSMSSLNLISNYLSERRQRTKIGDSVM